MTHKLSGKSTQEVLIKRHLKQLSTFTRLSSVTVTGNYLVPECKRGQCVAQQRRALTGNPVMSPLQDKHINAVTLMMARGAEAAT